MLLAATCDRWREANDAARTLEEPHARRCGAESGPGGRVRLRRGESLGGAAEMHLFGGDDEATELNELEQQFLI